MLKKIVMSIKIYNLEKGVFMSFEKEPHERIRVVAGVDMKINTIGMGTSVTLAPAGDSKHEIKVILL